MYTVVWGRVLQKKVLLFYSCHSNGGFSMIVGTFVVLFLLLLLSFHFNSIVFSLLYKKTNIQWSIKEVRWCDSTPSPPQNHQTQTQTIWKSTISRHIENFRRCVVFVEYVGEASERGDRMRRLKGDEMDTIDDRIDLHSWHGKMYFNSIRL